jgi:hypothetical protein
MLFQFTMHNARLSVCRDGKPRHTIGGSNSISEVGAWNIEDISWYFGCESKKKPPFSMVRFQSSKLILSSQPPLIIFRM